MSGALRGPSTAVSCLPLLAQLWRLLEWAGASSAQQALLPQNAVCSVLLGMGQGQAPGCCWRCPSCALNPPGGKSTGPRAWNSGSSSYREGHRHPRGSVRCGAWSATCSSPGSPVSSCVREGPRPPLGPPTPSFCAVFETRGSEPSGSTSRPSRTWASRPSNHVLGRREPRPPHCPGRSLGTNPPSWTHSRCGLTCRCPPKRHVAVPPVAGVQPHSEVAFADVACAEEAVPAWAGSARDDQVLMRRETWTQTGRKKARC